MRSSFLRNATLIAVCLAFAGLGAVPVCAQNASDPQPTAAPNPATAIAHPSGCKITLPQGSRRTDGKALLLLNADVDAEGLAHNFTLFQSSGMPELDKEVLSCAEGYPVGAARVLGQPTRLNVVVGFFVSGERALLLIPLANGSIPMGACRGYPERSLRQHEQGDVTVSYIVGTDGSTKDVKLERPSGFWNLDQKTASCIADWRFFPFTKDGQPIEVERSMVVHWKILGPAVAP